MLCSKDNSGILSIFLWCFHWNYLWISYTLLLVLQLLEITCCKRCDYICHYATEFDCWRKRSILLSLGKLCWRDRILYHVYLIFFWCQGHHFAVLWKCDLSQKSFSEWTLAEWIEWYLSIDLSGSYIRIIEI